MARVSGPRPSSRGLPYCGFGPFAAGQRNGRATPEHSQTQSVPSRYRATFDPLEMLHSMKVERILPSGRPVSPVADLLILASRNDGHRAKQIPQAWLSKERRQAPAIARLCPLPEDRNLSETLSPIGFRRPWTAYGCSRGQEPSPTKPNKTEGSIRFLRRAALACPCFRVFRAS